MPVLPVSYFIQPNSRTCQSTVLTMYASYIEKKRGQPQSKRDVTSIYDTINGGRPKHHTWITPGHCPTTPSESPDTAHHTTSPRHHLRLNPLPSFSSPPGRQAFEKAQCLG